MVYIHYCDRTRTAAELLAGACARYVERTGRLPQVAYVNSDDVAALTAVEGLNVYPMRYVPAGTVMIGVVSHDD